MTMVTLQQQQQQHMNRSQTLHSNNSEPYLSNKEPSFLALNNRSDQARIRTLTPIITASTNNNHHHHQLNRTSTEDDEIGVFGAEKYFNSAIDDDTCSRVSTVSSATRSSSYHYRHDPGRTTLNLEQIRSKIQPRTPSSVRSESSWNSRSVLLQTGNRIVQASPKSSSSTSTRNVKKILASFGCICSDKNSVRTKEIGEISFSNNNSNNNKSSSPYRPNLDINDILNADLLNTKPKPGSFRSAKSPIFHQQCKSPEVYGSSPALKTMSLERRLTMMSWDHSRRATDDKLVSGHHDSGSDASSDLFEIDSLTGKIGMFTSGRRPSDDLTVTTTASGCVTPTTGYAPSEASIQWSVVTASAADYASVISDYDDRRRSPPPVPSRRSLAAARESAARRRALLGCKSQKAVNVAGEAYRASPGLGFEPGSIRFPVDSPARFQGKMAHLGSPSPRNNSHLVYIK